MERRKISSGIGTIWIGLGFVACAVMAQPDYATRHWKTTSIESLPFEKRICRLYFDPIRPSAYDPLQGKHVERKPLYGLKPAEVAGMVATIGCDLLSTGGHVSAPPEKRFLITHAHSVLHRSQGKNV